MGTPNFRRFAIDDEGDEIEEDPKMGMGEAALTKVAEGATAGFSDEAVGLGAAILNTAPLRWLRKKTGIWDPGEVPIATTRDGEPLAPPVEEPEGFWNTYRGARDQERSHQDKAQKDQAMVSTIAQVGGAVLSPLGKLLPQGGKALGTVGRAIVEGGVQSAGDSRADLTKGEVGQFVKDTGTGALFGGVVGGAGAAVGGLAKRLANRRANELPKRILNEVAEGQDNIKTTPTQMKHLSKAEKNIVEEVVGTKAADKLKAAEAAGKPRVAATAAKRLKEADAVRDAYLSEAKKGLEKMQPLVDKVGAKLESGYKAFEKAGKADIDPSDFWMKFQEGATTAATKGSPAESDALQVLAFKWQKLVEEAGGKANIRMARKFTTEIQGLAAGTLGGLNEGSLAVKIRTRAAASASRALAEIMEKQAGSDTGLIKALKTIREHNPRMNALLTVTKAMKQRLYKEQTRSTIREFGKTAGAAVAGGATTGYFMSDQPIENVGLGVVTAGVLGALGKRAIPAVANRLERGITTAGIQAQRSGVMPDVVGNKAGRAARALVALIMGRRRGQDTDALETDAREAGVTDEQIHRAKSGK